MSREATVNSDGRQISVTMDGREVQVSPGTTILEVARKLNIHIPTLCTHEDLCVVGNCRICAVEIDGHDSLAAACAWPVTEPLSIRTVSPRIRSVRRHMIQLLLSNHPGECHSCTRNGACELAALAEAYGVDEVVFARNQSAKVRDASSPLLVRDMNKCVLCRRCVRACIDLQEVGVMEAVGKGDHIEIQTFGNKRMRDVVCIGCGQCVSHCPTAALVNSDDTATVWRAIDDPSRHVVLQISVEVQVALAEIFGMDPGTVQSGQIVAACRAAGFDAVFDTQLAVSLAVEEQSTLLIQRLTTVFQSDTRENWPVLSSDCSGFVRFMEYFNPKLLKRLSPLKTPEQLLGTLVRTYFAHHFSGDPSAIVSVAAVPCTSRKVDADSPLSVTQGGKNVDIAITTVELGRMLRSAGVQLSQMTPRPFDRVLDATMPESLTPYNSMLHLLMGAVYRKLTGNELNQTVEVDYEAPFSVPGAYIMRIPVLGSTTSDASAIFASMDEITLNGGHLRFGKCEGTANAKRVIEDIARGGEFSRCHYIEFLACPDGCFGGGGHPAPTGRQIRQLRKEAHPVCMSLPDNERQWFESHYLQWISGALDDVLTRDHFNTSYMPRGKFIR